MLASEYLREPCAASSLPFWKTEQIRVPEGVVILRDDAISTVNRPGRDDPYFKLIHHLEGLAHPPLPVGYEPAFCDDRAFARHICACYGADCVSAAEVAAWRERAVFDPSLWLALRDKESGEIAATGIGELDRRIGEGCLEWIQVSPEHRRRGLGRYMVSELLCRMAGRAAFATVSGRLDAPSSPLALYRVCGFEDPVIWHVITTE